MTFGSDTRKSKHGINAMAVGEVRVFDTPTEHRQAPAPPLGSQSKRADGQALHDTLQG
jgi:hypothetical protein